MKNKKIAIIGTVGLPARYGGFETLAEHLVDHLSEKWDISVYCSSKKYPPNERPNNYKGARLIYIPVEPNGVQSILYDSLSILHALFYADVLLILGVGGGFMLPLVRLFPWKKIVISIDGIEWKRNKWSKMARIYLWAAEWMAVSFSHADIADNESIQDYTAIRYKTLSHIIEYGADHAIKTPPTAADKEKHAFLKTPYAFNVCRIEPENNIEMILAAFAKLPRHPLVMVGNWNNSQFGITIRKHYAGLPNITLLDPIYDQRELDVLRGNCYLYVHGHSAGGTNPSLVEAMFLGLPILVYGVSYNRTTTEGKALYFRTEEELVELVRNKNITDLKMVAETMKAIANQRYTWKLIADKYEYTLIKAFERRGKKRLRSGIAAKLSAQRLLQHELGHLQNPAFFYEKR